MIPDQRFEVEVTAPDDDDRETVDAEQIQRWIAEHLPRHSVAVRAIR